MARVSNRLLAGLRGKLGGVVFRNRGGKTYVGIAPMRSTRRMLTDSQEAGRLKFQLAADYAKRAIRDPELAARYEAAAKKGLTAYNVAFRDSCHPPKILEIEVFDYIGHPGDRIRIKVRDDFSVESVKLTIYSPDGSIRDVGNAVPEAGKYWWVFSAHALNPEFGQCSLHVVAEDLAKNHTCKIIPLTPKTVQNDEKRVPATTIPRWKAD